LGGDGDRLGGREFNALERLVFALAVHLYQEGFAGLIAQADHAQSSAKRRQQDKLFASYLWEEQPQ
jgi:hypothetical protein